MTSLGKPVPCPSGLALGEGMGTAVSTVLGVPSHPQGGGRGLTALLTGDAPLLPQPFAIRRCGLPDKKHIASQKKLGGQERAAHHAATLGRASEPSWREEGQAVLRPTRSSPLPSPCRVVPRPLPSLLGGHLGARCRAPASAREGSRGRERERASESNRCRHWNLGFTTCTQTV